MFYDRHGIDDVKCSVIKSQRSGILTAKRSLAFALAFQALPHRAVFIHIQFTDIGKSQFAIGRKSQGKAEHLWAANIKDLDLTIMRQGAAIPANGRLKTVVFGETSVGVDGLRNLSKGLLDPEAQTVAEKICH